MPSRVNAGFAGLLYPGLVPGGAAEEGLHQLFDGRRGVRDTLARAQALLETSDLSADRISALVGFGAPTTFRERLRAMVGVSPPSTARALTAAARLGVGDATDDGHRAAVSRETLDEQPVPRVV